jgi:hypothetical protein
MVRMRFVAGIRLMIGSTDRDCAGAPEQRLIWGGLIRYTAEQKLQFSRRLRDSWWDLAVVLEIPDHETRRFARGSEAAEIWAWLHSRGRLDQLSAALRRIDRDDLAALLTAADRALPDEDVDNEPSQDRRPTATEPALWLGADPPYLLATAAGKVGASEQWQDVSEAGRSILRPTARLRMSFTSRTGTIALLGGFLSAFGGAAALVLLLDLFVPLPVRLSMVLTLPGCAGWALWRSWLVMPIVRRWTHPDITVKIVVGDLFAQKRANLVVEFSDTFDTDVSDDRVIARDSLQGQLVYRRYGGDHHRLDAELTTALIEHHVVSVEDRIAKPLGKLARYAMGTVAVLGRPGQHTFLVAYSRMGNDLVPRSSVNEVWHSLARLWEAVDRFGQRQPVAMPVVGSGLARIDALDAQNLVQLILLSYLARSRESPVSRELRLVVWPGDLGRFDLPEIARFLMRL